jgi:3-oxoacyl-[acyl-carrier-protein] synthase III
MNQSEHIDKVIDKQTSKEKLRNRLRLKTSIDCVRYLASQGCAFRGHDEGHNSKNRGNFLELIKLVSTYNKDVADVVLKNALGNAKYTSHHVQKYILHVLAKRVRDGIREEIGNSKFCIIVDEA